MFAESKPKALPAEPRPRFRGMDLTAVRSAYSRYANVYDILFGVHFEPGRLAAVRSTNTRPGQRILEVGVGTGLSLPKYRSRGYEAHVARTDRTCGPKHSRHRASFRD